MDGPKSDSLFPPKRDGVLKRTPQLSGLLAPLVMDVGARA
jgi:hypothetical protein